MAGEIGPDEFTMRAAARGRGAGSEVRRALPKGRADIRFAVGRNLQMRQTKAVAKHGLHKRAGGARVEAHLARMLAFDIEPQLRAWRRACAAQGSYRPREQQADPLARLAGALEPIERDLGPAIAAAWALRDSRTPA
jgi:hypothetical protein